MNKAAAPQEAGIHAGALLIAIAVTLFTGWLLFAVPAPLPQAEEMEVVLIESIRAPRAPVEQAEPVAAVEPPPRSSRSPSALSPPVARPHVAATRSPPPLRADAPPASTAAPSRLYTADGRVALGVAPEFDPMRAPQARPPGDPDDPKLARAKRRFERSVPIEPQDSAFAQDWESDGNLAGVLLERAGKRLKKIADKLPGKKQIQSARARPPPEFRFNPALHERPSDLGSEATGDAYKAAPIAFEKAPGLQGEASRRIRRAIGDVEAGHAGCDRSRLRDLLAPAIVRLTELEQIERAMASGVDPIRAEQLLPRSADMAYDQARRAIWYARQQLATCAA
ncbi:hypothetical protein [Lysobacter sp. CA199]|uniref:hypothetical protein n=1 Tax=Lysobacter sp. CA199 TaxID=3455608 RepID=UPI003F8D65E6